MTEQQIEQCVKCKFFGKTSQGICNRHMPIISESNEWCGNYKAKENKKVLNKPIATDDLGNEVYLCQYSKQPVTADKAIFLGPLIPSVSGTFVCHPEHGPSARKQSKIWFDKMDANCNTCKNLERIPHKKCTAGFLQGICKIRAEKIRFHPDDWMGNECWEQR